MAEGGTRGILIVAVGVTYDAKARFRSRALVRIGEPVAVERWEAGYRLDSHAAVRLVTADIARQLRAVAPEYTSWAQAEQLARIAEVVVRTPAETNPAEVALSDQIDIAERLAAADARRDSTDDMAAMRAAFVSYERDLALLGLTDVQVSAQPRLRWSLAWSVVKVVAALPLAVLGFAVHLVPFRIVKRVATRPTNEGMKATVKLLGCTTLFAVTYAAVGYLISLRPARGWGSRRRWFSPVRVCRRAAGRKGETDRRPPCGFRILRDRQAVIATVIAHRVEVVSNGPTGTKGPMTHDTSPTVRARPGR